jgi:fructokinase
MYLVCGDSLFDFFLESESGPAAASYAARAGGSPFNVAIGIARLGGASAFLTGLSTDMLGARLRQVLEAEGVSTRYCIATDRPTTLSLVGLDAEGVPAYQFYGNGAADIGITPPEMPVLDDAILGLHFGSYSIAVPPSADALAALAGANAGRFVSLDPNIRPTIQPDMGVWRARVDALLPQVDLLKISAEDVGLMYPGTDPADLAARWLKAGPSLVVVTDGGGAARGWHRNGATASANPPQITVIDTVGAGDTFQAALLAELGAGGNPVTAIGALDSAGLERLLAFAARAAAITCSRRGADLPRRAEL